MAATGPGRWARKAALLGVAALIVLLAPVVALAVLALVSPYASVAIPASCSAAVPQMPADRDSTVPGAGVGTLLASGADTNVVIVTDPGQTPALTAYIVDMRAGKVIEHLGIASEAVVAAISDGVVYLFDDKIGYMIDASTGERVHRLIETDNYRGLYFSGADRYQQTDAEIATLFGRSLFSYQHLDFTGIASGCYFAPPQ
jgi:hypothetical protein